MRIVYYTHSHYLEPATLFARAMSEFSVVHLLLELSPGSWRSAMFDMQYVALPAGVLSADAVLSSHFPAQVRAYWSTIASFNLVLHNSKRTLHPAAWWTSHQAMRFIRELKPDILHLDDPDTSLRLALDIFEIGRIPLVLNVHDPIPHSGEHNWRKIAARKLIFPHVHHFVLHNKDQVEAFRRVNHVSHDRVSVLQLGSYDIYKEWVGEPVAQGKHTVLFFGRLSPYKGLDVLYDAIQRVAAQVPDVRLIVAGSRAWKYTPPPRPALSRGGTIEVIENYIGNSQLAKLFQQATVVACPYLDATQSGVVLTAYAFDRPVVASSVGGIPEYVSDRVTGLLVPPDDPSALAAALVEILSNADLRTTLREGIQSQRAGPLGWDRVARQALDMYQRVLARAPRS
jgi:glycosyltransferase involved in cell wall biosynthesis